MTDDLARQRFLREYRRALDAEFLGLPPDVQLELRHEAADDERDVAEIEYLDEMRDHGDD